MSDERSSGVGCWLLTVVRAMSVWNADVSICPLVVIVGVLFCFSCLNIVCCLVCMCVMPLRVVVKHCVLKLVVVVLSDVRSNSIFAFACDPYHSGSGIVSVVGFSLLW